MRLRRQSSSPGRPRIIQYGVHDRTYPRNSRLRAHLVSGVGAEVVTLLRSRAAGRLRRALDDLRSLIRHAPGADVIILSEMRLTHAPIVKLTAVLVGARLVVDGFIGLHETAVGDWQRHHRRSPRAARLLAQDALAARCADLYLTDTEVRAASIRRRHPRLAVLSLPVGAPAWATPAPAPRNARPQLLYYGHYIPLHGLDLLADALDLMPADHDFSISFVGHGSERERFEARALASRWATRCRFLDSVPEGDLLGLIHRADAVLGVFGHSEKAATVIANKVWQGLACGRVVITRDSAALDEIADAAGDFLVRTEPGSAESLARAILALGTGVPIDDDGRVDRRLEAVVSRAYDRFSQWIRRSASSPDGSENGPRR